MSINLKGFKECMLTSTCKIAMPAHLTIEIPLSEGNEYTVALKLEYMFHGEGRIREMSGLAESYRSTGHICMMK